MKLNIRLKLILFTFCIVLLVAGSISLYSIFLGRQRILRTFEDDSRGITTLIAGSIVNDLYFLDLRSLRDRLESTRVNPDISYTYALDVNGVVLADGTSTNALRDRRLTDPFSEDVRGADSWLSTIEGGLLKVGGPIFMPDGSRIGHFQVGFLLHRTFQLAREATRVSLYVTVFCFGIGIVLAFMVATSFSRPILSMARASKEIGEGRLDTRLSINRSDELGTLAESVNQMAEALEMRHVEIKRAERELQERLQFEELVSTISARFANVPANELGGALSDGLRRLGEFFDADRCSVVEFSEDGRSLHSTYRWRSARLENEDKTPRAIMFSTVGERWKRGEVVVFARQEEIPENQRELREAAKQAGFKSHLSVPLKVGGEFIGAVGITSVMSEREWSAEVMQRFKFIGELFANAMTRKRAEEALQHLSGRLITAQEESRRRLARELHDDVSQRLAVVAIEAGKLEQRSHYTPELIHGKLQGMRDQIVKLAGDIHRISRQLHPSILDDLGLVEAMESECRRFSELEGIPVKFTADRFPEETPKDVSLCVYRVTQESLRNIAKHSKATDARVALTRKNGNVHLSVEDCGVGFDPTKARGKPGLGLASMEERVKLINGKLSVRSAPGQGTVIEIRAPLTGKHRV